MLIFNNTEKNHCDPLRGRGDIAGQRSLVSNATEQSESANGAAGIKGVALHKVATLDCPQANTATAYLGGCGRRLRRAVATTRKCSEGRAKKDVRYINKYQQYGI
jgi:hypothetical protein